MKRRTHLRARVISAAAILAMLAWIAMVVAVIVVGARDQAAPANAIVVLGAAQYEGRPSPVLRARLDHALELYERSLAPLVIVTGGTGAGDTTSEAQVGRRFLLEHGVPDSAIVMETHGLTTSQSVHAVAAIMSTLPGRRVILVSDPFHMLRLSILARALGLTPLTSPTRTSPISTRTSARWKYVFAESLKAPIAYVIERVSD
ncbi:MAG TPA: YdcF family protein [Gemmatimonadaceae bacterium]|nr:YdcF family protein [Gemmatimonadaceae bacterium]